MGRGTFVGLILALVLCNLAGWAKPPTWNANLKVRLLNADGTPMIPLPTVGIVWNGEADFDNAIDIGTYRSLTTVNANGVTFTGLLPGRWTLKVLDNDWKEVERREVLLTTGENALEWRISPRYSLTITLNTADGRASESGYSVHILRGKANPDYEAYRNMSKKEKVVTFSGLKPDTYTVKVSLSGAVFTEEREIAVVDGPVDLTWTLGTPASFTVSFITPDGGAPPVIPRLGVHLKRLGEYANMWLKDGESTLSFSGMNAGEWELFVGVDGIKVTESQKVTLVPGDNTITLPYPKLASLRVRVTPPPYDPTPFQYNLGISISGYLIEKPLTLTEPSEMLFTNLRTGTFELAVVQKYSPLFENNASSPWGTRTITLAPGENTVDWTLPPIATVYQPMTYADGTPIADRPLYAELLEAKTGVVIRKAVLPRYVDTVSAKYPIRNILCFPHVAPGEYQVKLYSNNKPRSFITSRLITVTPGNVTIPWSLATYTLTGTITRDGVPVTPAHIYASLSYSEYEAIPLPITCVDGRYRVADLLPGGGELIIISDNGWARLTPPAEAGETPIALQPGCSLEVHLSPESYEPYRAPMPGPDVMLPITGLIGPDVRWQFDVSGARDGVLALPHLPPGTYSGYAGDWMCLGSMDISLTEGKTRRVWAYYNPPMPLP
jgi:hypothetical protein